MVDREEYLRKLVEAGKLDSNLCEFIIENGILVCPASTKYHGNYEGGLFDHCLSVYDALENMTQCLGLNWDRPSSVGNVAWGHDVCKLDNYVKVEDDSELGYHYEYNKDSQLFGHGVKSVVLLQKEIKLTEEEMYCIMFHMGAYEKDQWDAYDKAIKKYPNVLFTHTADMCASKIMGV